MTDAEKPKRQWPPLPNAFRLPIPREAPGKFKGENSRQELEGHEGAEWFIEHLKDTARHLFKKQQQIFPMVLVLAQRDYETAHLLPEPGIVACAIDPTMMNSGETKDGLANWLRVVVRRTDAIGWGWMVETWTAFTQEAYQHTRSGKSLESFTGHGGRKEAVMITLQHRALEAADNEGRPGRSYCRSNVYLAEIKRGSKGARLADWRDDLNRPDARMAGRFVGVMQPRAERDEADRLFNQIWETHPDLPKAEMIAACRRLADKMDDNDPHKALLPYIVARIDELDIP
jgi:hypothetical protein